MQTTGKPMNTQEIVEHLGHVDYPITGKELMEACENMSHVSDEEREWVKRNIQEDRTYNSREELRRELKL